MTSSNAVLTVDDVEDGDSIPAGAGLGYFTVTNGVYTIRASGEDIEGTEDRCFFVHVGWAGDGEVLARLIDLRPDNSESEAGIMFRDGMSSGARPAFMAVDAGHHAVFRRRLVENYYSVENWNHGTNAVWLRLMRMGDTFIGHCSSNGVNWQLVWWTTMPGMPASLEVGLAATAHRNNGWSTNVVEMLRVGGRRQKDECRMQVAPQGTTSRTGEAGSSMLFILQSSVASWRPCLRARRSR